MPMETPKAASVGSSGTSERNAGTLPQLPGQRNCYSVIAIIDKSNFVFVSAQSKYLIICGAA